MAEWPIAPSLPLGRRLGFQTPPSVSSVRLHFYESAIRRTFGNRIAYGQIIKTLNVTDLRKDAAHRYSPAAVIAVNREVVSGVPAEISTSYVERGNLSIRMACRRFTRLTNGFSKKLENHEAAVSLYVAHYNLCRVHESLTPDARHQTTPAMALGVAKYIWSIGELIDAALATQPIDPVMNAPYRRKGLCRKFRSDQHFVGNGFGYKADGE